MEKEQSSLTEEESVKKVTLKSSLIWIISAFFILGGVLQLKSDTVTGIFIALAGLVIFPPFNLFLKQKARIELSWVLKVILFIILITIGGSQSTASDQSNSPPPTPSSSPTATVQEAATNTPVSNPTVTPNPEKAAVSSYTESFMTDVYPFMMAANTNITNAASSGSNYDFSTASVEIRSASKSFAKAQTSLQSIKVVPPALKNVHSLITRALEKYSTATQIMQSGIEKYDASLIEQGASIYQEGTALVNQATTELNRYAEENK